MDISASGRAKVRTFLLAWVLFLPTVAWAQDPPPLQLDATTFSRLRALEVSQRSMLGLRRDHADASMQHNGAAVEAEFWSFRRIEVYAPDAQLWVARAGGLEAMPRSTLRHFIGTRGEARMALSLTSDGKSGQGLMADASGVWALDVDVRRGRLHLTPKAVDAPLPDGSRPAFDCLGGLDPAHDPLALSGRVAAGPDPVVAKAATRRVILALDTDNELLNLKFSNNETDAGNYLAALVAAISAFYEQEPAAGGATLQLQIGSQILRPSTIPDPYPSAIGSDISSQLNEFGAYWMNNYAGVSRAFAVMISGKSATNNSASGIAWILTSGSYCDAKGTVWGGQTAGHYSINRVFKNGSNTVASDAPLVAHELGHNFGLAHTHCTDTSGNEPAATNTLDQCFAGEGAYGCYSGPTSCPTNGPGSPRGTLMSYCNMLVCGGSYSNAGLFHQVQVTRLNTRIASQPASCVLPLQVANQPPTITASDPIHVTEDVASPLGGISFTDPDAGSGTLTATFGVPRGTLAASGSGGVTVGGSAISRTLSGTLANLNAFLGANKLTYTTVLDDTASVALTLQINDNGNTGSGGPQSASRSLSLVVDAVNDAPQLVVPASLTVAIVGTSPVSGVSFSDVDAGNGSLTVSLTAPGAVTLTGSSSGGVIASGSGNTRSFAGTLANLNTYFGAGNVGMQGPGFSGSGTLAIGINDNGNSGSGGAKSASANVPLRGGVLFANGFE